ncbi:MAG: SGNH/GDSL hydrolase family protein [Lachnospiraceae bacterium]|nr:SGNH/GDSL hydrolase family protein [Lachnospiraceae bacterium]
MNKDDRNEVQLSDVKIIDLDKLEDDATIDYEKFSQEDNLNMETSEEKRNASAEDNRPGFFDHILKINWHLVLLAVLIVSVCLVVFRIKNWGTHVDLGNLDYSNSDDFDVEVQDSFLPLIYNGDAPAVHDDERNIVLFGNDTFAQNRGTKDDIANIIAELTDANVYNCAVSGSYLASTNYYIDPESDPMDAFNLYWLTTSYTVDNTDPYEKIFANYTDKISSDAKEAYDTLTSIDFNYVDVIGIMYDANDYLACKEVMNLDNPTDILAFTGNLQASLELIQQTYPHIRIIVMSPTYAYALGEDGDYLDSDLYKPIGYELSLYAGLQGQITEICGVSYVDNFYGTVNSLNADDYLLDHINLNTAGREKLAARFVEALEHYDKLKE